MQIRNIAIIAHVDHGKTTLVDQMFRQAGVFRENQTVQERVLDSNPARARERGITILAKNTAVSWQGVKINIVDTPGHADFGGEVERILRMVDGVVLLVDAAEGPMPQTRFVTRKALELGCSHSWSSTRSTVGTHALWRCTTRSSSSSWISTLHGRAAGRALPLRSRVATDGRPRSPDATGGDLTPVRDDRLALLRRARGGSGGTLPDADLDLDHSPYVGRIAIGRIERGRSGVGERVALLALGEAGVVDDPDAEVEEAKVSKLYVFSGLGAHRGRRSAARATSSRWPGLEGVEIGKTLTDPEHRSVWRASRSRSRRCRSTSR